MSHATERTQVGPRALTRNEGWRRQLIAPFHWVALAGAVLVVVVTAHEAKWNLGELAIITALTVGCILTSFDMGARRVRVSGSFLGLMLATVLLGGGPAAIVGVITIVVGWLRWREPGHHFRNNLVTYAWFPLISGLLFHAIVTHAHLTGDQVTYYLLVFATVVFALLLNVSAVAAYACYLDRTSVLARIVGILSPILAPELASNILTLFAVFLAIHLGMAGLALFAIVLIVFQFLVGELLTSQRRGEELRHLATTDELTGLANRKSFSDRLEAEIEACEASGEPFGVILLDLDRFKDINDTLGHRVGDLLLSRVAVRFREVVGSRGEIARLGGDEFALIAAGCSREQARHLAQAVADSLRDSFQLDDLVVDVQASVGIAVFPDHGTAIETLLQKADVAMYRAKETRSAFALYDEQHDDHSPAKLALTGKLRRAVEGEEIVVWYQPELDLQTQRVIAVEALVRWEHPQLGLLMPSSFVGMAEHTNLIKPLTQRVIDLSLLQLARWNTVGIDVAVAVNISAHVLVDNGFVDSVLTSLSSAGVAPSKLKLEVTESTLMVDPVQARNVLQELSGHGLAISIDDFGTGYSSLAYLANLPVSEVKIDRSFVSRMAAGSSETIIVNSTIDLAHHLGLRAIAEGVEDLGRLDELRTLGCDAAQGYAISRPCAGEHVTNWLLRTEEMIAADPDLVTLEPEPSVAARGMVRPADLMKAVA